MESMISTKKDIYKELTLDMLEEVGFADVKVYGDFTFEQPEEDCERVFFVCRK